MKYVPYVCESIPNLINQETLGRVEYDEICYRATY